MKLEHLLRGRFFCSSPKISTNSLWTNSIINKRAFYLCINQTQLVDQQKIIKLTIPAYSLLYKTKSICWTSTSFSWSFYFFNGKDSSVESFETIYANSGEICFHEPILLPAKPLNIDEEEDEEEEDTLLSWNERTQFLSDQEIKDALETIPNKSMGSNSNEFWILSAQNSSIYNCVDLLKDGDFIHKKQ
jgi:hypothetical protein